MFKIDWYEQICNSTHSDNTNINYFVAKIFNDAIL